MLYRKSTSPLFCAVVGAAIFAYGTGEQLKAMPGPSPNLLLNIATASSTSTVSAVSFNSTTFATIEPPPPFIPPGDEQQQG
jgi:4-diphosphocytidyl-2C-methyl-D-erythritol kinase